MKRSPIQIAVRESQKSPCRFRHGAVVTDSKGKILSRGFNISELHAEISALIKIPPEQRVGATVWSIRTAGTDSHLANARPCPRCRKFMLKFGVKRVLYSDREAHICEEIL
jgi:deoxycytidylate deaminase